jgi:putative oxidoreductase
MKALCEFTPLLGRILVAPLFLLSGIGKITGFAGTAAGMTAKGLPAAELLLVITIVVEIGGALMILLGWRARLGALLLFLWLIPVTLLYHGFWAVPPEQFAMQRAQFLKNLGLMSAMLFIVGFGPGKYSLNNK